MTREEILQRHYGKARREVALLWALLPVAVAIFVIVFAASIGRPRAGAMLYVILCVAPLVLLRDRKLGANAALSYGVGLILPGAAGFLATQEIWVTLVTALLGAGSVWLFHRQSASGGKPKLNRLGLERLNQDLRAAGYEEEAD